jgi:hypothetical protein
MWHFVQQKHRKEREEEQQHLANMTAIVRSFQEVNTQPGNKKGISPVITTTMTTSSSQQGSGACDCSVCFAELDSGKNTTTIARLVAAGDHCLMLDSSSSAWKRAFQTLQPCRCVFGLCS